MRIRRVSSGDGDRTPTAEDARRIAERVLGGRVARIARFPTGLAHFVYDVRLTDGCKAVVRLTRPRQQVMFAGAVYWYERLKPLGIPLPTLFHADPEGRNYGFPTLVMERLPGHDLGEVYPNLSGGEKWTLAAQVVDMQRRAGTLPLGPGFGYAWTYDDVLPQSWEGALEQSLRRCRTRLRTAGLLDERIVERVEGALSRHGEYLSRVQPICSLDDLTTKNVIVHQGRLSGIVDVDGVSFGDPLVAPALTRMSLLSRGWDTAYVDAWLDAMDAGREQRAVLDTYTAWFCVVFLSEFGHAFNQEVAPPVEETKIAALLETLDRLLAMP